MSAPRKGHEGSNPSPSAARVESPPKEGPPDRRRDPLGRRAGDKPCGFDSHPFRSPESMHRWCSWCNGSTRGCGPRSGGFDSPRAPCSWRISDRSAKSSGCGGWHATPRRSRSGFDSRRGHRRVENMAYDGFRGDTSNRPREGVEARPEAGSKWLESGHFFSPSGLGPPRRSRPGIHQEPCETEEFCNSLRYLSP